MIGIIQAKTALELVEKIEGPVISEGLLGTNTAGDGTFSTAESGALADVAIGDRLYISGVTQVYTVASITNATTIEVTPVIAAAHTANAVWRLKRGGVGAATLLFDSPYREGNRWIAFYEFTTF